MDDYGPLSQGDSRNAKANNDLMYGLSPVFVVGDDPAVAVSLEQASYSVAEGGMVTVKVQLSADPKREVVVPLTTTNQGGASSSDYSGVPSTVTFQSGDTEESITFTAIQDTDDDDEESVKLGFGTLPARVTAGATNEATVSITDNDDPAVTVRFEQGTYSVAEGSDVTVKVQLNTDPERTVTIPITTTNQGGATSGDYSGVPASVTFQSGDREESFTFSATQDTVDDGGESVKLGFGSLPARVTAGTRDEATVSITDGDAPAVTVRFEQGTYSVAEGSDVTVKVQLNTDPERTVTIPIATANQGGASSSDYFGVPSSVTFQSGDRVESITFTATLDTVEDDGESVKLGFGALPALVTAGTTDEATVSITRAELNRAPTVSATAFPSTVYGGDVVALRGTARDPDGDALTYTWTSDGGGNFAPGAGFLDTTWTAPPATETAHIVNLTLTATDTGGLSASVTVSVLVEPIPRPNAATDLRGTALGDNSVSLTWTIPSQPSGVTIANVQVQQRMSGGAFSPPSWDTVVTLPGPATFSGVPALAADRDFFFRIRLTTTHGLTADSRPLKVRTLTEAPAPRHFAASWPTQTSITLNWFTLETAAEYKLEYRKDGETEWTRISGDFDHLPSTSDHRQAFGVAAGLDCETGYDFRVSARGSGDARNDGSRYPSTRFGSTAAASAQTGECAQEERVTNLLVSIEPGCATLTWTPPSGDRDDGYRVERYSYSDNRAHRTSTEILIDEPNRVTERYEDCSPSYRTDGLEHAYIVTAWDNNPGPEEQNAFGSAYSAILTYGPRSEPEAPLNVRLTHDTRTNRQVQWKAPPNLWLTTVKTARAGSAQQQVVTDPWTSGYQVERHEYRRLDDGSWTLPDVRETPVFSATMTVGTSPLNSKNGYNSNPGDAHGEVTSNTFFHQQGTYTIAGLFVWTTGPSTLEMVVNPTQPANRLSNLVLVVGRDTFRFVNAAQIDAGFIFRLQWPSRNLTLTDGESVSVKILALQDLEWDTLRDGTAADPSTSYTDSTDKGDSQYVYRVWSYNAKGLSHYSHRGDWAFNGGDPGGNPIGVPQQAEDVTLPQPQQQSGEPPSNTPATGRPTINGTPQVEQTLTADTSAIADGDGLTNVFYRYQWIAGGSDIDGATGSSYALTSSEQGQTIQVRVSFTDDRDNAESLTSVATETVAQAPSPLTVSLENAAASHNGTDVFTFEIRFSEQFGLSYKTLRDDAFTVVGGEVKKAQRMDRDSDTPNTWWLITVEPDGNGDVTITLPATTDCTDDGAICTEDGRKLSNRLVFSVSGPGQ